MRALFMTLLVANVLFLAWAQWIDAPRETGAQDSLAHLPRLQLVGEKEGPAPTGANLPAPAVVPTAPTVAAPVAAEKIAAQLPVLPRSCTSVGPFNDIAHAARAAGLLTQRGFQLQQRAEEGESIEGYWVYVGGLQSEQDIDDVVARLEKQGFTDAHVMKNFSTNRRISVGMFSTRERAEKRADAVRRMGFQPEVGERKFPGTVYWVDVSLEQTPGGKQLPPEYLFADIGHAGVKMQSCPAAPRPAAPVAPGDNPDGITRELPRTTVASARGRH